MERVDRLSYGARKGIDFVVQAMTFELGIEQDREFVQTCGISAAERALQRRGWERMLVLSPEATATRILTGIEWRAPCMLVGKDTVQAAWL